MLKETVIRIQEDRGYYQLSVIENGKLIKTSSWVTRYDLSMDEETTMIYAGLVEED